MGLLKSVNDFIAENEAAQIEWEYATTIEKTNSLILALQNALNLSDAQVCEMFKQASKL